MKTYRILSSMLIGLFLLSGAAMAAGKVLHQGSWTKKGYAVEGQWKIVEDGGKHFVELDASFRTKNAPDLKLFLSPQNLDKVTGSNATQRTVLVAKLKSNKGAQRYEIPAGTDLEKFITLLLHCEKYSKLWSAATLWHPLASTRPMTSSLRLSALNQAPVQPTGAYVLYWMVAARRTTWNFALDVAMERCRELGCPLLVFEPLRVAYPWASDRLHRFVLQGMEDNQQRFAAAGLTYLPYVEPQPGEASGLLQELAASAALVITDDFPCFFLPRMQQAAAERLPVRCEAVDGNGLLPLRACPKVFLRAVDFRRFLQRNLAPHLLEAPQEDPLGDVADLRGAKIPSHIEARWPRAKPEMVSAHSSQIASLPIDHSIPASTQAGGSRAAQEFLDEFVEHRLVRYQDDRTDLINRSTSALSPHLHFGHISSHQIFRAVSTQQDWHFGCIDEGLRNGKRVGWWGMDEDAEGFLDQLVTWRELGFNMSWQRPDFDSYASLPAWAQKTLAEHQGDPRPWIYSLEDLTEARTHDDVWNAAQRELRVEGVIHNYLRMLWGKKILEWSPTPQDALATMIELNNRYALDGRDPNSYSGIFWCLGRYDRAWGPERPIFGKIRYMSSDNTRRKLRLNDYLARYGPLSLV